MKKRYESIILGLGTKKCYQYPCLNQLHPMDFLRLLDVPARPIAVPGVTSTI